MATLVLMHRCIQGDTLYMCEVFGVDFIDFMFYGEASKWTVPPCPAGMT